MKDWLRWIRRRLSEAIQDNLWLLPSTGAVIGAAMALAVGTGDGDPGNWTISVDRSRDILMNTLALVFTALSISVALASVAAQNVVGRFGSRTLRIYVRRSADRWVMGAFAMAATFILVEQYQLRRLDPETPAPITGLSISIIMFVITGVLMMWYVAALIGWVRVDHAAATVGRLIEQTASRVSRHRDGTVSSVAVPSRPANTTDVRSPSSGYLAEVDSDRLLEACRSLDAMITITRPLGAPVVKNEPIGWIDGRGSKLEVISDRQLSEMIDVSSTRELALSLEFGIVALVDIAIMALSPAVNDPNTAVEVIEELSFRFGRIAELSLGPYAVPDADSWPPVVVAAQTFGELVELATTQIVLYGVTDPYVLAALRRFATALDLIELSDGDRHYVDKFAASLDNHEVGPIHPG